MRKSLILLVSVLAVAAAPASAVVDLLAAPPPGLDNATFDDFYTLDNTPLQLSGGARASALFAGQGWAYTAVAPGQYAPWESPTGDPTPHTSLQLLGQYPPTVPPGASPPVDTTRYQNVIALYAGTADAAFAGAVNDAFYGVTSVLFDNNIRTFVIVVSGSGENPGDGLGGPLWFAFFGRNGERLPCVGCYFAKATNTALAFRSDQIDIAGVQVWHEDTKGQTFSTMQFSVTPIPGTISLMLFGAAALGVGKRIASRPPVDGA